MKEPENGWEIGGGISGVGRFFTDPCHCGSGDSYGVCCGAEEGDSFLVFCENLSLEREFALEFAQLAWRIARDTPAERWTERMTEIALEVSGDHPENLQKLLRLISALLEAHRVMFPGIDGKLNRPN